MSENAKIVTICSQKPPQWRQSFSDTKTMHFYTVTSHKNAFDPFRYLFRLSRSCLPLILQHILNPPEFVSGVSWTKGNEGMPVCTFNC